MWKRTIFSLLFCLLCTQSVLALTCVEPSEHPFEEAHSVYLARVMTSGVTDEDNRTIEAKIEVIKIYKATSLEQVKKIDKLSNRGWSYDPPPFKVGSLYMLYDHPYLGDCEVANREISLEQLQIFEDEHPPIWVIQEINKEPVYKIMLVLFILIAVGTVLFFLYKLCRKKSQNKKNNI